MGWRSNTLSDRPQPARIPLAVDPWLRFQADWEELYSVDNGADGLVWGIPGQFQVKVSSDASLSIQEFTASRKFAGAPKIPTSIIQLVIL